MPDEHRKSPRRRAKQARARATVEAVVEAAARVLVRRGYAGATTNRIAETAGVSVGTLYQYFRDKDAVFEALMRRELEVLERALSAPPAEPDETLEAAIARLLAAAARTQRFGPALYRALEQVPGAVFRRRLARVRERVVALVAELLEAHRDELRVRDPRLAAFVLVSAAEGVAYNAPADLPPESLVPEIAALFRGYLGRAAARAGQAHPPSVGSA